MFFQYTALNPQQKKLSGTIEGKDETDARARLNELSLSIISLTPLRTLVQPKKTGAAFSFEATDAKGKKVLGTVDAASLEAAFERLTGEYLLSVNAIFPKDAPDSEKQKALEELRNILAEKAIKKEKTAEEKRLEETDQKELTQKVKLTLQTVQEFLETYGKDMKPEERDNVQAYLNQLYRIKDSTNVKHIRQTCEKMLLHIEKRKLFLQETKRVQEEAVLKVKSHSLLEAFRRTGLKREIDFPALLKKIAWVKHIFFLDDEEIIALRGKIKESRKNIWEFRKLAFKTKNAEEKHALKETIQKLTEEKKRFAFELRALKASRKSEARAAEQKKHQEYFGNFSLFTGWLLAFYLVFYFLSYPFQFKKLPILFSPPATFDFYGAPFLKSILMLLFFLRVTMTLQEEFFIKKAYSSLVLYPAMGILYLFFFFNFVI